MHYKTTMGPIYKVSLNINYVPFTDDVPRITAPDILNQNWV